MSRILETDLTEIEGDPTVRAVPHLLHESCKLKVTMPTPRGNASVQLDTRTLAGSPLATAITTVLLVAAGCLAMGAARLISAPMWITVSGLVFPSAVSSSFAWFTPVAAGSNSRRSAWLPLAQMAGRKSSASTSRPCST